MAGEVTLIEGIPVELNLGQPEQVIGRASVTRNADTGEATIEIILDLRGSDMLSHMVDIFEIKAIGFAGVKRRPQDGR